MGGAEGAVLGAGAHGELVQVGFADHDGAGLAKLFVDVAVVGRDEVLEDPGGGCRASPLRDDEVFDGHRDACQGCGSAAGVARVGFAGLFEGEFGSIGDVGMDLRFDFGDAIEDGAGEFEGGELLRAELFVGFVGGEPPEVAHSSTARTRT